MITPGRLIILLFAFSIIACEKNNENLAANPDPLIGSWFNPQYNDSIVTFERSEGLFDNEYGFTFKEDNTFIERKRRMVRNSTHFICRFLRDLDQ